MGGGVEKSGSLEETGQVIEAGADLVMLPMWRTPDEVEDFIAAVGGKAKTVLLLETKEAVECLDEVLDINGIDEIHIGLNDLHLSYGLTFMFELLANGTVESLCDKIRAKGIPYGFGGIARIGEGTLPAEKIVLEHYRLGSSRAILSRSFCNPDEITSVEEIENIFRKNMAALREFEKYAESADEAILIRNKQEVKESVDEIVASIRRKYGQGRT